VNNSTLEKGMRRLNLGFTMIALVAIAGEASAQAAPATDVFLAPLSIKDGAPIVGKPVNVTQRPGYDNQPSFTPDSRAILFTSTREDGQSDIYRFDLSSRATTRVTTTPESEYSATTMPDGRRFAVIRVEKDSTQRLWSFANDGSDPKVVVETLKPVGYHAWIDANNLALFVLGRPNALVHADVRTGKSDTLARDIGRSLAALPDKSGFSFVRRVDSASMVTAMSWPSKVTRDLIALPRGSQDLVWLAPGLMLTSSGSTVLAWRSGATAWSSVGDYAADGLSDITRLSVSRDGKWLAIVAIPKP
jgi:dipeptidyl aminopeptidase/acylaminoacyl peptidase